MYPTKFSPHSSQKLVNLERRTAIPLAKKRPHPLTRTAHEKRATPEEKIFLDDVFGVATLSNRTPKIRTTQTDAPILIRVARFSAPCRAPKSFCERDKPLERARLPLRCSRIST